MHFGTSWYPEHWPRARWSTDLDLMRSAGMTVLRLGDFAWSRLEPAEGRYDLDWFAEAVDTVAAHGLRCVLATPTAGPPVWLTDRHPEVLATGVDGRRATHGNRAHAALHHPRFRQACVGIAEAMARRFGDHPAVVGWQVDNELNTVSYDDGARRQFHAWLARRYGSIDELNRRWHTVFWSQEYADFVQVPIPVGVHHPSLVLAWRRFVTDMFRDVLRAQADVIRRHAAPHQWISHNVMSWYDHMDHAAFAADLDLVTLDFYVGHLDFPDAGAVHDSVRGLKRRPYWVMEAQPGNACWAPVNHALDRGEARRLAWQAVGHGADAFLYWQWRGNLAGQEQYHGTLVGPDGRPRPFFAEAAQLGQELAAAAPALAGTTPVAEVAILQGYEDRWAIDAQRHHVDFSPVEYLLGFYRPLRRRGVDVDIVAPDSALDGYRLVVAPSLHLIDEDRAQALLGWVRAGGHLVLGVRTGMKDRESVLLPSRQPGPLAAGVSVLEYYALEHPVPVVGTLLEDGGQAMVWAEWLVTDDPRARVLLRYGAANGWLDGQPAVVSVPLGAGTLTYCGAWLDEPCMAVLTDHLLATAAVAPPLAVPDDVEVCRRVDGAGRDVLLVLNHGSAPRTVVLPRPRRDALTGQRYDTEVKVAAGDVRVLADPDL